MIGGLGGTSSRMQALATFKAMRISHQMLSRETPSDQMRRGDGGLGRTLVAVAFLGLDSRFDSLYDGLQLAFNVRAIFGIKTL